MMRNRSLRKRASRLGPVSMTAMLAVALAGCGGGADGSAAARTSHAATPATPPGRSTSTTSGVHASARTPITIEVDGQRITGTLDGSATSASLIAQLPLTLEFRDYGGQEKVAELPAPLSLDGAPDGSDASPLTIGYYAPDQRLVLYYDHVGYFSGIVPLGTFENTTAVKKQTSDFAARIRVAK
jgi:hypothetical protein